MTALIRKKYMNLFLKKPILILFVSLFGVLSYFGFAAASSATFPSTNDQNKSNGWAYVEVTNNSVSGGLELTFISTRNLESCFEYRTDGDEAQASGESHPNPDINDLYTDICVQNEEKALTVMADSFVEARLSYGDDPEERFDWTDFNLASTTDETADFNNTVDEEDDDDYDEDEDDEQSEVKGLKAECKNGGWEDDGYRNQGQCIRHVNTGQDSRED